jgi:hypothetical protein
VVLRLSGSSQVQTVNILDLNQRRSLTLNSNENKVIQIEPGHYNGFVALNVSSELLVFSDETLENSLGDEFRLTLEDLSW